MTAPVPFADRRRPDELADLQRVVEACERWGYGNVMQCASAAWREVDPHGAFTVGIPVLLLEKIGFEECIELFHAYEALIARRCRGYVVRVGKVRGEGLYVGGRLTGWFHDTLGGALRFDSQDEVDRYMAGRSDVPVWRVVRLVKRGGK